MLKESIKEFIEFAIKYNIISFIISDGSDNETIGITKRSEDVYTLTRYYKITGKVKETYSVSKEWAIQRTK